MLWDGGACEAFIYIVQGCFTGTAAITWLLQCLWRNPEGYGYQTTAQSKSCAYCSRCILTMKWLSLANYILKYIALSLFHDSKWDLFSIIGTLIAYRSLRLQNGDHCSRSYLWLNQIFVISFYLFKYTMVCVCVWFIKHCDYISNVFRLLTKFGNIEIVLQTMCQKVFFFWSEITIGFWQ